MRPGPPVEQVRRALAPAWSAERVRAVPSTYFRLGDVLLLNLPLPEPVEEVAAAYAGVLGMRTVLGVERGIEGEFRLPKARILWGEADTETTHVEDGIHYRLDPRRIMWSQGNLSERRRVASWRCPRETIVDLFAGVGYFTLPLALHSGSMRVIAIEKNPVSHAFLVQNARLNGVASRVEARLGDCREAAPNGEADRVLMGLLPDSLEFLPTAVAALRPDGGFLHVHRAVRVERGVKAAYDEVHARIGTLGRTAHLRSHHRVKSYGPSTEHVVLDVEVRP